ncbi:MAG: asparagine synthase (glutamine-hydrolyzing) [Bacteroidia bacterium]
MCGVFGYLGCQPIELFDPLDVIEHRGPSSTGFLQYNFNNRNFSTNSSGARGPKVAMAFKRLSIIDLSPNANQPFSSESGDYHITFNGEIYNYIEIRTELIRLGHRFRTSSDTEVVLVAYQHWGKECFSKFNGMWAIAIFDVHRNRLILSRDRFGIKPLYHYKDDDGGYYWASEIKQFWKAGIKKTLNEKKIKPFLESGVLDYDDQTFFDGVLNVRPGTCMIFNYSETNISPEIHVYWKLTRKNSYERMSYKESVSKFKELFYDSIRLRFRSDVTVGSCLSGGLDSSSIVSVAASLPEVKQEIKTFTSKFDIEKYDESGYVHLIEKKFRNVKSYFCQLTEHLFLEEIDKVIKHQDEPFVSMGILAQWEVMKLARKNNVTVLLDGQGGDELLAGYRKFYVFYLAESIRNLRLITFFKLLFGLLQNRKMNMFSVKEIKRYIYKNPAFNFYSQKGLKIVNENLIGFRYSKSVRERMKLDVESYSYPVLLRYEDRNSMAFSIETRVPFMDYRLVEFLYSIPIGYKIKKGFTKYLMRDALTDILPEEIQFRKSKLGFATPQDLWMKNELNQYFQSYFDKMTNPYLANEEVAKNFSSFPGNNISSELFFRIYCFDKWYSLNFK